MNKLEQLYKHYPFKSARKFVPIAIENGFTRVDALIYLNSLTHDVKYTRQRETMLPIYSEHQGAYQFDTLIPSRKSGSPYFLIFINVNTRKLYAYPMKRKDTQSVLKALTAFITEVKQVSSLTSDEDRSYVNPTITSFLIKHQIDHQTTFKNDHHRLGIINRVIKTLRDMNGTNRDFTESSMMQLVKAYNNTVHSSTRMKPNDMNKDEEMKYINQKQRITDSLSNKYNLKPGDIVRVINDRTAMGKKRTNVSNGYVVDSKQGNKYIIKAKDNSATLMPRYKLIKGKATLEESIDSGKHAVIDKIVDFDSKRARYKVLYEGGETDSIPISSMREGRPTRLSLEEVKFWKTHATKIA